jgi:hypothetical protein
MNEITLRNTDSWADVLPAVGDLSQKIAGTAFVPDGLRGKPAEIAACILTGREIGIGPMQALNKIHVINGRPTMSAELMRSLVMAAGHEITYPHYSDNKVTAQGRRADSTQTTEVTWTMADAQRIGVANKATWKQYPRQMLAARATSELCRLLFPDALGGISYTTEELQDGDTADQPRTAVKRSKGRKAPEGTETPEKVENPPTGVTEPSSAIEQELEPEPEPVDVIDAEIIEETEPVLLTQKMTGDEITGPQTKMLGALMNTLGMKREAALEFCASQIGRKIESRNELTKDEATKIIDSLVALTKLSEGGDDA